MSQKYPVLFLYHNCIFIVILIWTSGFYWIPDQVGNDTLYLILWAFVLICSAEKKLITAIIAPSRKTY